MVNRLLRGIEGSAAVKKINTPAVKKEKIKLPDVSEGDDQTKDKDKKKQTKAKAKPKVKGKDNGDGEGEGQEVIESRTGVMPHSLHADGGVGALFSRQRLWLDDLIGAILHVKPNIDNVKDATLVRHLLSIGLEFCFTGSVKIGGKPYKNWSQVRFVKMCLSVAVRSMFWLLQCVRPHVFSCYAMLLCLAMPRRFGPSFKYSFAAVWRRRLRLFLVASLTTISSTSYWCRLGQRSTKPLSPPALTASTLPRNSRQSLTTWPLCRPASNSCKPTMASTWRVTQLLQRRCHSSRKRFANAAFVLVVAGPGTKPLVHCMTAQMNRWSLLILLESLEKLFSKRSQQM
jgi:hypothetical protein